MDISDYYVTGGFDQVRTLDNSLSNQTLSNEGSNPYLPTISRPRASEARQMLKLAHSGRVLNRQPYK